MRKILSAVLISLLIQLNVCAVETILDVSTPKENMYRFGTTDSPEIKADFEVETIIKPTIKKETTIKDDQYTTYADLSIKNMSLEISKSLEVDFENMQSDLSLLWQGAATNSDTIKFAIYKLSNPDKDRPDKNAVKQVLGTIAGMSTILGAGMGNPVLASSALIGGNTLGIMSQNNKSLNYKYTQVTDADMIILVRKVEELQQRVVNMYYDYMSAREQFNVTTEMIKRAEQNYKAAQSYSKEVILMTDTFYREALDEQLKARGNYYEKRSCLEQLVGVENFRVFEQSVDNREKN